MADKIRRTVTLPRERKEDLDEIKGAIHAKTDVAAINDAVSFRARFADRTAEEVQDAISFRSAFPGRRVEELQQGLSLLETARKEIRQGHDLLLRDRGNGTIALLFPKLG